MPLIVPQSINGIAVDVPTPPIRRGRPRATTRSALDPPDASTLSLVPNADSKETSVHNHAKPAKAHRVSSKLRVVSVVATQDGGTAEYHSHPGHGGSNGRSGAAAAAAEEIETQHNDPHQPSQRQQQQEEDDDEGEEDVFEAEEASHEAAVPAAVPVEGRSSSSTPPPRFLRRTVSMFDRIVMSGEHRSGGGAPRTMIPNRRASFGTSSAVSAAELSEEEELSEFDWNGMSRRSSLGNLSSLTSMEEAESEVLGGVYTMGNYDLDDDDNLSTSTFSTSRPGDSHWSPRDRSTSPVPYVLPHHLRQQLQLRHSVGSDAGAEMTARAQASLVVRAVDELLDHADSRLKEVQLHNCLSVVTLCLFSLCE